MNTLSDLRSTLDRHADGVTDTEAVVRATAVRHRVGVVRRRRRATAGGMLALVVGVTLGVVGVQRASSTPPPVVFGVRAPETLTSLGYTYRTDGRAQSFAGHGSVKLGDASRPRLYSWTTDRPTTVRLVLPDGEVWTSHRSRFTDFVEIPAGQTGSLRVSVPQGSVALASYDLTDQAPPGYTRNGSTFRQTVDGTPLLAAAISDAGTPELRTSFVAPGGLVDLRLVCSGLPKGYAVNVSLNGDGRLSSDSGTCDGSEWFDPASHGFSEMQGGAAGTPVRVRVWVSTGFKDSHVLPASAVPQLRMGIGVYGPAVNQRVGGYTLPTFVEQAGHTWSLVSTTDSAGGPLRLPAAPYDRVAGMAWRTHGRGQVEFRPGRDMTPAGSAAAGGQGAMGSLWVPAGDSPRARIVQGTGTFGVGLYRRAD